MENKYNYLTAILILFAVNSFSQVNTYFQNNPEWHIKSTSYSGYDCSGYEDSYNYYINGDTILDSLVYKKIYKKGIITTIGGYCLPINSTPYINISPSFYLRSLSKKIFIFNPWSASEQLLYDFNLVIGDTLPMSQTYNPSNHTYEMTVATIDSIYTPLGYLKRFALSGGGNDTLFEGIGSTGGLDESVFPLALSGYHNLLCYSLNNIPFINSTGASCDLGVGIPTFEKEKSILVFPNPFSDKTTLQFNREIKNASLNIFNINGVNVKSIIFSGTNLTFEKGELNPGLYYYQVEVNNENILTDKLIIID